MEMNAGTDDEGIIDIPYGESRRCEVLRRQAEEKGAAREAVSEANHLDGCRHWGDLQNQLLKASGCPSPAVNIADKPAQAGHGDQQQHHADEDSREHCAARLPDLTPAEEFA